MAAFQVFTYGRFWVFTEASARAMVINDHNFATARALSAKIISLTAPVTIQALSNAG